MIHVGRTEVVCKVTRCTGFMYILRETPVRMSVECD